MDGPPPAKRNRAESRWSQGKYCNVYVPSYIPPEFIVFDNGVPLDVFLLRCQIEDARRMSERASADPWFQRRYGPLHVEPRYDSAGNRINTFQALVAEKRERAVRELLDRAKRFHNQAASGEKEIIKKIYFTPDQMENKTYGAILGSRGVTHQKLESETGCRIVLAGRGITEMKKAVNLRHYDSSLEMANEKPHCRITAPNEIALQKAVQRVEWILSDAPDAIRFRDQNRKRLAMDNGTYDPKTWVDTPIPGEAMTHVADDDEIRDFLASAGLGNLNSL